jgi:hypothetical protein
MKKKNIIRKKKGNKKKWLNWKGKEEVDIECR